MNFKRRDQNLAIKTAKIVKKIYNGYNKNNKIKIMLYWKYSSNRIFFLNEYWIFIPTAILANYVIIRKIRLDRQRIEQLRILTEQIEREKKIRLILLLSLGLNGFIHILPRGGSTDLIDVEYLKLKCEVEEGVRYLDNQWLRNIIHDLYPHKRRNKIIYITATAVCHLANQHGQTFLALPFALGSLGLTSIYQTLRKVLVMTLLGGVGPLVYIGGPVAPMFALMMGISGLKLAFNSLDFIPTSPVDVTKDLEPRIPGMFDVVVVNNQDKIIMNKPVQENHECWLPDQRLLNPNCEVKPTEIPDAIDSVFPDLEYKDTVNMQDITGLDRVEFTDKYDLGQTKPTTSNPPKGKEVNFLEKFGDSGPIGESEGWDTCENEFRVPEKGI